MSRKTNLNFAQKKTEYIEKKLQKRESFKFVTNIIQDYK